MVHQAIERGHLAVLQYASDHLNQGWYTGQEMDLAARNGHVRIMQWLDKTGLYFDIDTDNVAVNGHLHVLQYLARHSDVKCTLYVAAAKGHFDMLEWLLEEDIIRPIYARDRQRTSWVNRLYDAQIVAQMNSDAVVICQH